jgi:hypothetical protein
MNQELKMRRRSDLCYTAIDEEFDSRDVTRFVGREEGDSLGDFVLIPAPS